MNTQANLSALKESWPSPYVTREKITEFSGGILHPRSIANLDSLGLGPKGRIRVGRKIAYPIDELIQWMEERSEAIGN